MGTNTLQHSYRPYGAAKALFECRDDEVLMSGPAGTGKSLACLEKLNMLALLNPGMRGLIVRKTLVSLGSTALVTWRERVVNEALEAGTVVYYGGSAEQSPQYRYKNGSVITIGGIDKPTRIMSSEYDVVYVQEAIELSEAEWEALTTRLRYNRISFQQLIADTNPDRDTHWLNARAQKGRTTVLHSVHEDNPVLYTGAGELTEFGTAYIGKLDALTGVRYLRLRKGMWVAAEGIIYEEWEPQMHLVDRFDIPDSWARWWTVDFGFTNPFVLQCWAEDPDGRLYLYRELYMTKQLVEDHARAILHLVKDEKGRWKEPQPQALICDHDAEDRATLERHLGLPTAAAKKSVSDGLQAVSARLRKQGDGKPRLMLMRDSLVRRDQQLVDSKLPTCTAEEIPGYVWADGRKKEEPMKRDDHGCDAMRYMVAHLDLRTRVNLRST